MAEFQGLARSTGALEQRLQVERQDLAIKFQRYEDNLSKHLEAVQELHSQTVESVCKVNSRCESRSNSKGTAPRLDRSQTKEVLKAASDRTSLMSPTDPLDPCGFKDLKDLTSGQVLSPGSVHFRDEESQISGGDIVEKSNLFLQRGNSAVPTATFAILQRTTVFGMEFEDVLHLRNTTNSCVIRMMASGLVAYFIWYSNLREPRREGLLARLLETQSFDFLSAMVIVFNAGVLAYEANRRATRAETSSFITVAEVVLLIWYLLEVSLKVMVHRNFFFLGPQMHWNIFDFLLVLLELCDRSISWFFVVQGRGIAVDTAILRSLKIMKLAKILRVMRILRVFNDLCLMLTTVMGSCVSLMWSFLMLAFFYYMFGLIFLQCMTDYLFENPDVDPVHREQIASHFGSLSGAMYSLLTVTNGGGNWDEFYVMIEPTGRMNCALFFFFVGFVQISLMNILTALFVERAMRLAQPDVTVQAKQRRVQERCEADELRKMLVLMDLDNSGRISADEFRKQISSTEMRCYFSVLGLDIRNAQEFFEMMVYINQEDEVDIECFVEGCMQMRGNASGIAQQHLLMETRLLRRSQFDLFQHFNRKLDVIVASFGDPDGREGTQSASQALLKELSC